MITLTPKDSKAVANFQRNVRRRIDEGHITITELANRIKIERPCLSNIVNGKQGINLANAAAVAAALGCTLSDLIEDNAQENEAEISQNQGV